MVGCGDDDRTDVSDGAGVDDSSGIGVDGNRVDAGVPTMTRVTGTFEGMPFTLTYPVIIWGEGTNPIDLLCVANRPIAAPDCGVNDGQEKLVFVGQFWNRDGMPEWVIPGVEILWIGTGRSEFADAGTLSLPIYDPPGNRLAATFEVTFPSGVTSGSAVIP